MKLEPDGVGGERPHDSRVHLIARPCPISAEGIRSAERNYFSGARFEMGDVISLDCEDTYDCGFARGLSLYNTEDLEGARDITDTLLAYLKPNGVMIFDYYINLCERRKSESWIYHSPCGREKTLFFIPLELRVYFSLRIETLVFGSWALSFPFTLLAALISRCTGIGSELIAIVPRCSLSVTGGIVPAQRKGVTADCNESERY
jgi:hypothetical protein